MKKNYLNRWIYAIPLLDFIVTILLIPTLPNQIPVHFDMNWQPDRYGSRMELLIFPILLLVILILGDVLPHVDPKHKNYANFKNVYTTVFIGVSILMVGVQIISVLKALDMETVNLFPILMGGVFAFLGNLFPKIKANYFMGIKTPWALSDEDNWYYTHRIGGKYWFFGGFLMMFTVLLPSSIQGPCCFTVVMIMTIVPMIYSYLFYRRKLKGEENVRNQEL